MAKNWFITGTSSGFGRALTERLLAEGHRVTGTLRRQGALDDLKARYGAALTIRTLDVTDIAAIRQVVDNAFADMGRIDVVVNNAGYGLFGAAEEATDDQIRQQIDTNVIGSVQVVRAALPHLRAQGGGRILQIASMGAHLSYPAMSYYHLTKWAIEGFIDSVAQEVAGFGVQFTMVEPGVARTRFFGGDNIALAAPMDVYDATPAGDVRRARETGDFPNPGDPVKMAEAMIRSTECEPAPKRLALGSDAYTMIRAALVDRIAQLDAQKDIALSTDVDDWAPQTSAA